MKPNHLTTHSIIDLLHGKPQLANGCTQTKKLSLTEAIKQGSDLKTTLLELYLQQDNVKVDHSLFQVREGKNVDPTRVGPAH